MSDSETSPSLVQETFQPAAEVNTDANTEANIPVSENIEPSADSTVASESNSPVPLEPDADLPVNEPAQLSAAPTSESVIEQAVTEQVAQQPRKQAQNRRGRNHHKHPKQAKSEAENADQLAYRPEQILQRLLSRPGIYRAYLHEAEALLYQIRLVGLGPALAVLLSQTEDKSKRRIYWDISKWVFKEQRIKGKNVRSLMESIVYGDPRFLLKATHSVVIFLEELERLSGEEAYQPQARSNPA